jgi:hypothetical protein
MEDAADLVVSGETPVQVRVTAEEGAGMLQRDLQLAKRLGFRFVRPKIGVVSSDLVPDPIWTESVERSLDLAAELDVVICPEIHSPTPIKHPVVDDYIDLIERTGTKHFGLLLDTGIFQDRPIPLRPRARRTARPADRTGGGARFAESDRARLHLDRQPLRRTAPARVRWVRAPGRRPQRPTRSVNSIPSSRVSAETAAETAADPRDPYPDPGAQAVGWSGPGLTVRGTRERQCRGDRRLQRNW